MIGWRLGWVCGNELLVRAFADVKDNCDSGQFIAIQKAAITALSDDHHYHDKRTPSIVADLRAVSRDTSQASVSDCKLPGGSYFLYVPAPRGVQGGPAFASAEEASQFLIHRTFDGHRPLGRSRTVSTFFGHV